MNDFGLIQTIDGFSQSVIIVGGAMDSTVAHSDGYVPRRSCTRCTTCSRISGENLFDLFRFYSLKC